MNSSGYGNFDDDDGDVPRICSNRTWNPLTTAIRIDSKDRFAIPAGMVVAHCEQDLNWLEDEIERLEDCPGGAIDVRSVHIYSKCGKEPVGAPSWASIIYLPNIGRCDHSYAYHLALTPSTKLQNLTIFLKDSYYANRRFEEDRPVIPVCQFASAAWQNSMGFGCGMAARVFGGMKSSDWHLMDRLGRFAMDDYTPFSVVDGISTQVPFQSPVRPLGKWLVAADIMPRRKAENLLHHKVLPVCYGGQFAVAKPNIALFSQEKFRNLQRALERGDNIEEGHFIERLWAGMLSSRPFWPGWTLISNSIPYLATLVHGWPHNGMLVQCVPEKLMELGN